MLRNNKIRRDKRGDIPTTILVLGVFVVCMLAILTFVYSDIKTKSSFSGIKIIEKANLEIEKGNLDYYYLEKKDNKITPNFSLDWIKEVVIFSVEYNP